MQETVLSIILPQIGIMLAASGIILSLARDVYDMQGEWVGLYPNLQKRQQLRYRNPAADCLRTWLKVVAWLIFMFYAIVAIVVLLLAVGILPLDGSNNDIVRQVVQTFHFIIIVILSLVLVLGMYARGSPTRPAPPTAGPFPTVPTTVTKNHGDQNE